MTSRYTRFGPYILFRKIENDGLGELWRAGRTDGSTVVDVVALRKLTQGDRGAVVRAMEAAIPLIPSITGTTVVRDQHYEIIDGIPTMSWDYSGGRTLRHVVSRARAGGSSPNPMPTEQALSIVEKLAQSLETLNHLKAQGKKLVHGALTPHFVWITDEGEVRVAGQQLGQALVSAVRSGSLDRELGPYIAPEIRNGNGEISRRGDVYSLGAILHLVLTGEEVPNAAQGQAFTEALAAATLMTGEPIPGDIRPILEKALSVDPEQRYKGPEEMRADLAGLLLGGNYAPTTFNLAFYISSLLRKEMEGEAAELDRERSFDPSTLAASTAPAWPPAAAAPAAAAQTAAREPESPAMFGAGSHEEKKSRAPLVAAVVALLAIGAIAGGYVMFGRNAAPESAAPVSTAAAVTASSPELQQPVSPVITAEAEPADASTDTALDEDAKRKALEDAINRRLQEEMMKLQSEYDRRLQQERQAIAGRGARTQSEPSEPSRTPERVAAAEPVVAQKPAPPTATAPASRQVDEPAPSQAATADAAPTSTVAPPPVTATQPPPRPVAPAVQEGDLVEIAQVDSPPRLLSPVRPDYPPLARKQRVEASVILSVLISETGDVQDVKVLRGEQRKLGFDDAAIRAIRGAKFSPAVKSGKKVRTWMPIPVVFKL